MVRGVGPVDIRSLSHQPDHQLVGYPVQAQRRILIITLVSIDFAGFENLFHAFDIAGFVEAPSIVGETLTELAPGPIWRSDRRSALEVRLRGGVLSSVPNETALAGANALALIDEAGEIELVTAAEVELIGPQHFRLSGFTRGLGGSEAAAQRHLPAGARVVVLDGSAVSLTGDLADLGRSLRYRVGPARHDVGDPTMVELVAEVSGPALRPLSPVHPKARRTEAGVALSWLRRTRVDGDSWDLAEVPLGENVERYEVVVLDGEAAAYAAVVNEPNWLYPADQEILAFGSVQSEIAVAIRQLSAVVGAGQEWRGRIVVG